MALVPKSPFLLLLPSFPRPTRASPPNRHYQPLRLSSSTPMDTRPSSDTHRVIVCGGGVIGVCTAYFLSKKGASVTLIEQSSIACAASGKAGGFLALDWCDGGLLSNLARTSFNLHRTLSDELDGQRVYGYRLLDTLSVTISESDEKKSSESSSRSSSNVPDWVNGSVPRNVRTIGTTQTTAQVHPQMFTRTLMTMAVEKYGAKVVIGKVSKVVEVDGRVGSVVLEDGGVLETDSVVLALGPWSAKLGMLSEVFRVYGLKAHSIVLEPKEGGDVISPHALFLSYLPKSGKPMDPEVYPRPTGEVYICGMSSKAEVPDDPESITPNPESIKVLKRVAGNVSTYLREGEAQVKAEQACFLPCTDDDIPVIGKIPGLEGCYVATGHSCWGILNGPATGAALAELVLDGCSTIVDLSLFSPARFVVGYGKR